MSRSWGDFLRFLPVQTTVFVTLCTASEKAACVRMRVDAAGCGGAVAPTRADVVWETDEGDRTDRKR